MAISGGDGSIILTTRVDTKGLSKGLQSMKSMVGSVSRIFAAISAGAAATTAAITKMAVSAYADYEQLVGGIETLFGKSANKVMEYANQALMTTGVSANEYMQQVTSFAASLISSTAGDTAKAADVANMALMDISDNVNKMGSSMESVTWAYQGFAKQQYMLLDNLRLGYGGTKTEMERLLRDAEAITGVKYDISNLADVYNAIHVIQQELGITGTTTKEAETTISGSLNMVKASWQNLISAIAGGGDLDRAINSFVYSLSKFTDNIVPVIERTLIGLGQAIQRVLPKLVQSVVSALIQAIPALVAAVYNMIIGLFKGIIAGINALFTGKKVQIAKPVVSGVSGGGGYAPSGGSSGGGGGSGGSAGGGGKSPEEKQIEAEEKAIQDKIKALQKENKQIQKNDKANQRANKKQLASFDDINTLSDTRVSEAEAAIDANNEEIDQLQEQLDLLREKKQAIQKANSAAAGGASMGGGVDFGGAIGGLDVGALLETDGIAESFDGITNKFQEIAEIAQKIWDSTPIQTFVTAAQTTFGTLQNFIKTMWGNIKNDSVKTWENMQFNFNKIGNNLVDLWISFWSDFNDAVKAWGQPIINSISDVFNSIWATAIDPAVQFITKAWADFAEILVKLWDEHGTPLLNNIGEFAKTTISLFQSIYDNVLEPIITPFLENMSWLWDKHLKNMVLALGDFILSLKNGILEIYNKFIAPFVKYLLEELSPAWSALSSLIVGVAGTIHGTISDLITGLLEILTGLIDFITGVFTLDWEKAWNGVATIFKGIWDRLVGVVKGAINLIIDGVNALIAGLNKLSFDVPDWVPEIGGKTWGINIPKIPKLAQGTVIPPNREFMTILGDQKKGVNIEAPLQTIVDAFNIALANNNNAASGNIEVVLELDGRELGRAVVEQGDKERRRIGTRLVIA